MAQSDYLKKYSFNWETLDVMASGTSAIDAKNYLANFESDTEVQAFLRGYGYDLTDPIESAEMFGNFQEALQFIKKYFLKEGNIEDGLELSIPPVFYTITDISELLLIATGNSKVTDKEEDMLWASLVMKVMHTILHLDKDLRSRYFSTIQTQIFDRFYKYLHREEEELFITDDDKTETIPLVDFETKSTKTRDSIIIKLLHKKENVAEELFDRIGIRFVTHTKLDAIRLLKLLYQNHIVVVNNIKPSRSQNSLLDLEKFREQHKQLIDQTIQNDFSEEEFLAGLNNIAEECGLMNANHKNNEHSSTNYRAIHFTCRQLIKYKNPFYVEFNRLKRSAKKEFPDNPLVKSLIDLDTSAIAKDIRFFYPFEVQITDKESHKMNTDGEASHAEYKRSQLKSAQIRLFKDLIQLNGMELPQE